MKLTNRPKWKIIVLTAICLIGLLAVIGGSFAAYTSQAYQRGVARNRDNETVRFTSNYLQACAYETTEDDYAGRTILFESSSTGSLTRDIYVYNYANGNENLVSQKDITYDLKITFSNGGNEAQYSVTSEDSASVNKNGNTYTLSNRTLIGRSANYHKYTITFPASDLDKLKIIVSAIPVEGSLSATNNQILAAVIAPCTGSVTNPFTKHGEYVYKTGSKPKDYDGFNYEVSISSGKANAVLKWNSKVVEIDRFFLVNLGKTNDEIANILAKGELGFEMDQAEGTGDYLIPFYIKDKSEFKSKESWEDMKVDGEDIISFNATPIEASGETNAS